MFGAWFSLSMLGLSQGPATPRLSTRITFMFSVAKMTRTRSSTICGSTVSSSENGPSWSQPPRLVLARAQATQPFSTKATSVSSEAFSRSLRSSMTSICTIFKATDGSSSSPTKAKTQVRWAHQRKPWPWVASHPFCARIQRMACHPRLETREATWP